MAPGNRYDLDGKVVLVTGAGTGIGRAIARGFLDNGALVAVSGRRTEPLRDTVAPFPEDRSLVVSSDISDPPAAAALVDQVVSRFGRIDVVVSNAAAYIGGDLADLADDAWNNLFAVNVDGLFRLVKAALPQLEATRGNVIAISSVSGLAGDWGQSAYNATKHAINGLIRSLALDYGSRGVRFNAVAPAFTETEMTAGLAGDADALAPFINRIALGRPGQPQDIVGPALFLATDDAAYVTGTVLVVDGGTTASTGQPHLT